MALVGLLPCCQPCGLYASAFPTIAAADPAHPSHCTRPADSRSGTVSVKIPYTSKTSQADRETRELVRQRTTTISLGLFAAWACHDLEELFTLRETSRTVAARMPDWVPLPDDVRQDGLSQQHLNLGISLMGAYFAAVSALGVRSRGRSRLFRSALLAFGLHGFGHIGATAALRQYTSGVATSPTIVIPYWLWARRALAREGLSDRDGTAPSAAASFLLIPTVHVVTRLLLGRKSRGAKGRRT
jgi:hypothetical protein